MSENQPNTPTPSAKRLPPWAIQGLGWVLAIALSYLAARYGIQPAPLPPITIQATVVPEGQ